MLAPVKSAMQDARRLREIAAVLTKHGFSTLVKSVGLGQEIPEDALTTFEDGGSIIGDDRSGAAIRFRNVLEDLGPTFIKLGQILSTRPDIMPTDFMEELKHLQDRVPPVPFSDVREQVEAELGDTIENLFVSFNEKPLAAASIGQVHRATLEDGSSVVVKAVSYTHLTLPTILLV